MVRKQSSYNRSVSLIKTSLLIKHPFLFSFDQTHLLVFSCISTITILISNLCRYRLALRDSLVTLLPHDSRSLSWSLCSLRLCAYHTFNVTIPIICYFQGPKDCPRQVSCLLVQKWVHKQTNMICIKLC